VPVDFQLGRPKGHSPAEERSCRPVQALGVQTGRVDIVQACAGLRVWPGGDHVCVDCQFGRP
jgi:hypothetical protein